VTLQLSTDVHVPAPITYALRLRGIDAMTCQTDGRIRASDEELLKRASGLGRIFFTQDEDLLGIASRWTAEGRDFSGVIYCHQLAAGISTIVSDLELIVKVMSEQELNMRVVYLPLG